MSEVVKQHFNSSTLKAIYNPETEKAETTVTERCTCFAVGETPLYYTVEIAGVSECEEKPGAEIVNGIWKCKQTLSPYGEVEGEWCYWVYLVAESVWIELLFEIATDTLMVSGAFWAAPANWYSGYAYILDGTADCDDLLSGSNIANRNTECKVGWYGEGGTASWCRDWNPGGC